MKAQLCAGDHQGIPHVVAGIAHIYQLHASQTPQLLPDGEHVRQHLGRMIFVRQSVPDRDTCMLCQFFHDLLSISPVLNAVINTPQHSGRVGNALLFPDLGALGI